MKTKRDIAKEYMILANKKWGDLVNKFYLCHSVGELADKIVFELFEQDIYNDIPTYYKTNNGTFKILCELEKDIFFQFDILWKTGFFGDSGLNINNGKFRLMNKIPKGWKDIWDLLDIEEE